jgi:hypothetical protein
MKKLIIIGSPKKADAALEAITQNVWPRANEQNPPHIIRHRCKGVIEAVDILTHYHQTIDVLDIVGHGHSGSIKIGDDHLFDYNENPNDYAGSHPRASEFFNSLADYGRLRLLGCSTSTLGERGRMMLLKVAQLAKETQLVFGTLASVEPQHFDSSGFKEKQGLGLLYSSLAALDNTPPNYEHRLVNIGKYWTRFQRG